MSGKKVTYTNRSTVSQPLTLEQIEAQLQRFAGQRVRRELETLPQRGAACMKAMEWGFQGIGLQTAHLTVAPDVLERMKQLPEMQPATLPLGVLQGLPVYEVTDVPTGWWMAWEEGRPVAVGQWLEENNHE